MNKILTIIQLFTATLAMGQSRSGDCLCYQGDVLADKDVQVIVLQPARTVTRVVPAEYETRTSTYLIQPATTTSDPECPTCVVEVPAITETISIEVEIKPETVVVETIPAVTREIRTKYIKDRGRHITRPVAECGKQ